MSAPITIAYLGPEGTYSEEAARLYGGLQAAYVPFASIDEVVEAAEAGTALVAVVPVENSTEGPVTRTLDLLLHTSLRVIGEVLLPIHHQLISKAKNIADVREVSAHPQALAQSRKWLDAHVPHAERKAAPSNAQAAATAAQHTDKAAVASQRAAELYNLNVLAADIEDNPDNTTRFLVLSVKDAAPTGNDKTSLICSVPNEPGTLYQLLGILAKRNINMTKLESRPAAEATWDYNFYIDIDGHLADASIAAALKEIEGFATFVKVAGSYPKAS